MATCMASWRVQPYRHIYINYVGGEVRLVRASVHPDGPTAALRGRGHGRLHAQGTINTCIVTM